MKAVVIRRRGGPEVLEIVRDHPEPRVRGPHDVVVRVAAASVNPVDTYLRAGKVPVPLRYPWILGGDACGTVEAVGSAVTRFAVGARVLGLLDYVRRPGCYAERALFRESELVPAPDGVDDVQLAALPLVALTAWQALIDTAGLAPGARVLIAGGGGGIGSVAIPIAKAHGAHVLVLASEASRPECLARGADEVIDYRDSEALASDPRLDGLDVILDAVGGYYPKTIARLRSGGTFVTITSLADDEAYTFANAVQHVGRLASTRVAGLFGGPRVRSVGVRPSGERLARILALVERGALPLPAVKTMRLDEAADAHRALETRRTKGKLVLVP